MSLFGDGTQRVAMRRRQDARARVRVEGEALDVADLPSFGFSHRSLMWWGTVGLMAIEGTAFALAIFAYFYLRSHANRWPMSTPPPALIWGIVNTVVAPDAVEAAALSAAREIAALPPTTVAVTRRLMRGHLDAVLKQIEAESSHFRDLLQSDEARAAFAAFLARKK